MRDVGEKRMRGEGQGGEEEGGGRRERKEGGEGAPDPFGSVKPGSLTKL